LNVIVKIDFPCLDASNHTKKATGKKPKHKKKLGVCHYLYFSLMIQQNFMFTYCFGSYDCLFPMISPKLSDVWNSPDSYFYKARVDLRENRIPEFCKIAYEASINCEIV
jgi:hypothetical protein